MQYSIIPLFRAVVKETPPPGGGGVLWQEIR